MNAAREGLTNEDLDPAVIVGGAQTVRDFIENYHEKSEEQSLFPRQLPAPNLILSKGICFGAFENHSRPAMVHWVMPPVDAM